MSLVYLLKCLVRGGNIVLRSTAEKFGGGGLVESKMAPVIVLASYTRTETQLQLF